MLIPKTLGLYLVYFQLGLILKKGQTNNNSPVLIISNQKDRLWLPLIDPSVPSSSRAAEIIIV